MEANLSLLSKFDPSGFEATGAWGHALSEDMRRLNKVNDIAFKDELDEANTALQKLTGQSVHWKLKFVAVQNGFVFCESNIAETDRDISSFCISIEGRTLSGKKGSLEFNVGEDVSRDQAKKLRAGMKVTVSAEISKAHLDETGAMKIVLRNTKVEEVTLS